MTPFSAEKRILAEPGALAALGDRERLRRRADSSPPPGIPAGLRPKTGRLFLRPPSRDAASQSDWRPRAGMHPQRASRPTRSPPGSHRASRRSEPNRDGLPTITVSGRRAPGNGDGCCPRSRSQIVRPRSAILPRNHSHERRARLVPTPGVAPPAVPECAAEAPVGRRRLVARSLGQKKKPQ